MPPYLAGRELSYEEFRRLLGQDAILENMVLTGLRGVGKTVLLDTFKPIGIDEGWYWVGVDRLLPPPSGRRVLFHAKDRYRGFR